MTSKPSSQQQRLNDINVAVDVSEGETRMSSADLLTTDAVRRVARDVKDITREPNDNIVYIHSTRSVNCGYAMVVGTPDTPYFCTPMFYKLVFPTDYPHSPPKMSFLTYASPSGTPVRLHPNYYTNGKCCLSLLNSWNGDKWTGCQTLRSLLTTVLMTLTDDPITNEPGFSARSEQNGPYSAVVVDACLSWIARFLTGKDKVRFCEDDVENSEVNAQFRDEFIKRFVKDESYGKTVVKLLEAYPDAKASSRNAYVKWIRKYDNTEHNIYCYRASYRLAFEKTRVEAISALSSQE